MTTTALTCSPALVGRGGLNQIRLHSSAVSRYHGAFLFEVGHAEAGSAEPGKFQYVDLGSANGTWVDGRLVEADEPIDIRHSTVIEIAPFRLTVDLRLAALDAPALVTEVRQYGRVEGRLADPLTRESRREKRALEVTGVLADLLARFEVPGIRGATGGPAKTVTGGTILSFLTENDPHRLEVVRTSLAAVFERAQLSTGHGLGQGDTASSRVNDLMGSRLPASDSVVDESKECPQLPYPKG